MADVTLYVAGESGFHNSHPLTKLYITGLCFLSAIFLPQPYQALLVFGFVLLPLASWGGLLKKFIITCVKLIIPFAISLFVIQGFFAPGSQVVWSIGSITLTVEGLMGGFSFGSRIFLVLGAATLLMFFTRPDHLMLALTERGLPHQVGYIVVTTMQIIPRFQEKAETILNAQRSRGLETEGSLAHRLRMLLPLVGPLILGSIIDVDERAIALEARAFSYPGKKTNLQVLHDTSLEKYLRVIMLIAMAALPAVRIWLRLTR